MNGIEIDVSPLDCDSSGIVVHHIISPIFTFKLGD